MKIMNRIILSTFLLIFLGAKTMSAQSNSFVERAFDDFFTFAWDVNIPMGDKFVDKISYAGAKMEYRKMIDQNFSLGFDLSWNSYYELVPSKTYHLNETTDITTDLYRYNYTLPMAVTANYYLNSSSIVKPYVGLGMGALYSTPKLYFNIYEIDEENWGFLVRPELGAIIKFDQAADIGILLAARYSMSTNEETSFRIENLQALGFQLGFVWLY
jgi:hypothetical protein